MGTQKRIDARLPAPLEPSPRRLLPPASSTATAVRYGWYPLATIRPVGVRTRRRRRLWLIDPSFSTNDRERHVEAHNIMWIVSTWPRVRLMNDLARRSPRIASPSFANLSDGPTASFDAAPRDGAGYAVSLVVDVDDALPTTTTSLLAGLPTRSLARSLVGSFDSTTVSPRTGLSCCYR